MPPPTHKCHGCNAALKSRSCLEVRSIMTRTAGGNPAISLPGQTRFRMLPGSWRRKRIRVREEVWGEWWMEGMRRRECRLGIQSKERGGREADEVVGGGIPPSLLGLRRFLRFANRLEKLSQLVRPKHTSPPNIKIV